MHHINEELMKNPAKYPHQPGGYRPTVVFVQGGQEETGRKEPTRCRHCGQPWSPVMPLLGCYRRAELAAETQEGGR